MNPFKNKKGLGRGLSSLIGDTPSIQKNNKAPMRRQTTKPNEVKTARTKIQSVSKQRSKSLHDT